MINGLIIAGSKYEADAWIRANGLCCMDYKYVSSRDGLSGCYDIPIFLVGQYYQNPLYVSLMCWMQINYLQSNFDNVPPSGAGKDNYLAWNKNKFVTIQ